MNTLRLASFGLDKDTYVLKVAVPGASKEDVSVKISGNILFVNVAKTEFVGERDYYAYIPSPLDRDAIKAKVNNGMLVVTSCGGKEIEVE